MTNVNEKSRVQSADQKARDLSMRRVAIASVIGSMIEWYDFTIYGTAATLVFNAVFFPTMTPLLGTLVAVSTYGVGFLARPLGGAIFGHFGDKLGRKKMLAATVVLMGLGTALVGCLPSYGQAGVLAPVLLILLRLVQGVGLGGEWGGAVLLMVENAHPSKRGLFGSLVQSGSPFGVLISIAAFGLVSGAMSNDAFLSWGWRLPFLISLPLAGLGLWIRLKVAETPVFQSFQNQADRQRAPLKEVFAKYPGRVIAAIGLKVSEISWAIVGAVFSLVYITQKLHLPRGVALEAIQIAAFVQLLITPFYGYLSDRVGRKPVYIFACLFSMAYAFPLFWILNIGTQWAVTIAVLIAIGVGQGIMFGVGASVLPELFPTGVRYTGASLGFQVGAALSGGFSPIIMAWLFNSSDQGTFGISIYLVVLAGITLIATLSVRETAHEPLQ